MLPLLLSLLAVLPPELEKARDLQDRAAIEKVIGVLTSEQQKKTEDPEAHYRVALAYSILSEVALEQRDKGQARRAAEAGIKSAERAVALKGTNAEYHRILGTLCGQVIPANVLAGLSFGKRAQESINKAIELGPKSARAYLSRGVGSYYLPAAFGGGIEPAMRDFKKAIEIDPNLDEAHLWLGLALRKANRNADARKAFEKSLSLNPDRVWTKQQLEKTPAN